MCERCKRRSISPMDSNVPPCDYVAVEHQSEKHAGNAQIVLIIRKLTIIFVLLLCGSVSAQVRLGEKSPEIF